MEADQEEEEEAEAEAEEEEEELSSSSKLIYSTMMPLDIANSSKFC